MRFEADSRGVTSGMNLESIHQKISDITFRDEVGESAAVLDLDLELD